MQDRQLLATRNLSNRQSVTNQPRHAVVRVGTSLGAFIASCAPFQVEHEQTLCQEQTLVQVLVGLDRLQTSSRLFVSPENLIRLREQRFFQIGKLLQAGCESPRR